MITLHDEVPAPAGIDVDVDPGQQLLVATEGDRPAGAAVWRVEAGLATVDRIASVPGADSDVDVLAALRTRARDAGLTAMVVEVAADQAGLLAALQDATVLSTYMVKPVPTQPPPLPAGFAARAMTPAEYAGWKQTSIDAYTEENLPRCGGDRELAEQRSAESFERFLPDGLATADTRLLTLTDDGAPAGDLWLRHHWPRFRDPEPGDDQTFTFDVAVVADRRGRGLGRAAMLAAEHAAIEVGDRQLGLNVFGGNAVANGLYRSLGYVARSTVFDVPL